MAVSDAAKPGSRAPAAVVTRTPGTVVCACCKLAMARSGSVAKLRNTLPTMTSRPCCVNGLTKAPGAAKARCVVDRVGPPGASIPAPKAPANCTPGENSPSRNKPPVAVAANAAEDCARGLVASICVKPCPIGDVTIGAARAAKLAKPPTP